jgi:hypothetical protein
VLIDSPARSTTCGACARESAIPETLVCTAHVPLPLAGRIVADGDAFRFDFDDGSW